jgi:hypothetical protein
MLKRTMVKGNFLYIRINKIKAKHLYEKGESVFILPKEIRKERPKILKKGMNFVTNTFDFDVSAYDLLQTFKKRSKYPCFYFRTFLNSRRKELQNAI